jgi:hypothetical protein
MPKPTKIKARWIDRWLCSDADELLEREGATANGIAIIKELNRAYQRSGLTARIVKAILSEAQCIHSVTGSPVKILEIGTRDGSLLGEIGKAANRKGLPLEINGVEFRSDLAILANEQLVAQSIPVVSHYEPSRSLDSFASSEFDIVFSSFVLHHQTQDELKQLLSASFRVSRHVVFHLDLTRSYWALVAIWSYYTMFGYRASREDAVLSCRRAYRPNEVVAVMNELGAGCCALVRPVFPLYWTIHKPFESD